MPSISITIKDHNAERLDSLAEIMDRSRSWLANEAIELYLAHQDWMDAKTAEAAADIDAGAGLLPHDEVIRRSDRRLKSGPK